MPWARNVALEAVREMYEHLEGETRVIDTLWVNSIIEQARRRPDQVRDEAADFGTQARVLIDAILRGLKPEISPELTPPNGMARGYPGKA